MRVQPHGKAIRTAVVTSTPLLQKPWALDDQHHLDLYAYVGQDAHGEGGGEVASEGLAICASLVSLLLRKLTVEKLCGTA